MSFHHLLGGEPDEPDSAADIYFASLSRSDMQQILTTHGIQWTPDMTRRDLSLAIMEAGLGPPEPQTTDLDTPPQVFRLLEALVVDRLDALIKEISRSALTQRLIGQQEALDWVMQQIEDIRDANTAKDPKWAPQLPEPCNTCRGQGWVIEGQSMGFPSGEQIECPDCIPPGPVDTTQQQPGESRADWKNRTFAMQYGRGPVQGNKITPDQELDAKLLAYARYEGGPQYMGWPSRWFNDPHWRCINNHVSTAYTSVEGHARCRACLELLHITYPEDTDGWYLPAVPDPAMESRNQFKYITPWVQS